MSAFSWFLLPSGTRVCAVHLSLIIIRSPLFADNSLTQFTSILVASMKEGRIMGPFEKKLKWARGEYAEECQLI